MVLFLIRLSLPLGFGDMLSGSVFVPTMYLTWRYFLKVLKVHVAY